MTSGDSVLKQGQLKNDFNKCLKSWVGSLRVVDMLRFVSAKKTNIYIYIY